MLYTVARRTDHQVENFLMAEQMDPPNQAIHLNFQKQLSLTVKVASIGVDTTNR